MPDRLSAEELAGRAGQPPELVERLVALGIIETYFPDPPRSARTVAELAARARRLRPPARPASH
jgi:hypothetical protein